MLEHLIGRLQKAAQSVSAEDIIMAIYSQIGPAVVLKNHGSLHSAIYSLRNKPQYKSLLGRFTFNASGITPYSKNLEQTINRLETFSIFGTLNPGYDQYQLNMKRLQSAFGKFGTDEQRIIKQLGKELKPFLTDS